MAYIINRSNEVVAIVSTELRGGTEVQYAYDSSKESINANRDANLVNAKTGKISHAAKWAKSECEAYASLLNDDVNDEFIIR